MNEQINLGLIFLTGLTTGGLTCLAMQGGLLASVLNNKESELQGTMMKDNKWLPIGAFVLSKLVVYTILGALLGALGSVIELSSGTRGWLQILIGIYLLGV